MTQMYGADVAQLRALAAQFDRAAEQLESGRAAVNSSVHASRWVGPDAHAFRSHWDSTDSAQISAAARELRTGAQKLRANADGQERVSAVDGGGASGGSHHGGSGARDGHRGGGGEGFLGLLDGGIRMLLNGSGGVGTANDVVELARGKGHGLISDLPPGTYLSAGLKGLGLGDALIGVVEGVRDHDVSGTGKAVADGVFTFAKAGPALLWTGLKSEVGFFIPLDKESADKHMTWMEENHPGVNLGERYSGVQGFINLGNDNVERQAPWMNRAADAVMKAPAEWLYNAGIKLY